MLSYEHELPWTHSVTLILGALALALITAILFLGLRGARRIDQPQTPPDAERQGDKRPCPLCGSRLGPGERVHSVVFATKTEDKIMEISGCPHCRPPATLRRVCPVCKKDLRPSDVVTARVFERRNASGPKKTHVHVLGCPRCRA
jgi:hypothetical protein